MLVADRACDASSSQLIRLAARRRPSHRRECFEHCYFIAGDLFTRVDPVATTPRQVPGVAFPATGRLHSAQAVVL